MARSWSGTAAGNELGEQRDLLDQYNCGSIGTEALSVNGAAGPGACRAASCRIRSDHLHLECDLVGGNL